MQKFSHGTFSFRHCLIAVGPEEDAMGFGRGILFWLLGIPIPIIILLAIFWHH